MKKSFMLLIIILLSVVVIAGCGGSSPTTSVPATSAPTTAAPTTPGQTAAPTTSAPTTPAAGEPQYGGTLRMIMQAGPGNIGYQISMSFADMIRAVLWAERLMVCEKDGSLKPCLAESWTEDPVANTITFKLRQDVKFHDGTPFNAEAARWNIQEMIDYKTLPDSSNVKSLEVVDEYTLKVNLSKSP